MVEGHFRYCHCLLLTMSTKLEWHSNQSTISINMLCRVIDNGVIQKLLYLKWRHLNNFSWGHIHPRLALTISTLYNVGSCWPITLIVFTVRRKVHVMKWINAKVLSKVLGTLEKQKVTMSAKTLDMHRVLVKVRRFLILFIHWLQSRTFLQKFEKLE